MLVNDQNKVAIENAIEDVYNESFINKGLILTEDDFKCKLYARLIQEPAFSEYRDAYDPGVRASSVHAEVSWFNAAGHLAIKPDLTILEPEGLSILYTVGSISPPPHKQFNFAGSAFIFELKFVRNPKGITAGELRKIKKDFDKVDSLFQRLRRDRDDTDKFCYFVVLSKFGEVCPEFEIFFQRFEHSDYWKLIFRTLDVTRPTYR